MVTLARLRAAAVATLKHPLVITLLLLPSLWVAAKVILYPAFRPDRPAIFATLALIAAFALGGRTLWRRPGWTIWCAIAASLALIPAVIIARAFGQVSMLSLLFHAEFGMKGSTLRGLEDQIIQAVLAVVYLLVPAVCLAALWHRRHLPFVVLSLALLAGNPVLRFLVTQYGVPAPASDLVEWVVPPKVQPDVPRKADLPDIVVIYLEGTDRRYADPADWGDLYAPLQHLADTGTTFTGVGQIEGTGWSLAGMVASQCGVPLVPRGLIYKNNYDGLDGDFMPNITCLGDILAARGYRGAYVVGGDEGFAGIADFYRLHGGLDIYGLERQTQMHSEDDVEAAYIDWVLDDQMTYDSARIVADDLMLQDAPFYLVVETIGPHGRTGYLSRACSDTGKGVISHDIRRVVACTLADTEDFVTAIRAQHAEQRPGRKLGIVILSDHLSHHAGIGKGGPGYANANTAIFVGLSADPGTVIGKPGAMIDVFPTLLNWAGFSSAAEGNIGRSLLGSAPTVAEHHGIADVNAMLMRDAALSRRLWD